MEKELEQFREEVRRLRAGRRSGSLPFPEALRAFAVRYIEHTRESGGTMREAAAKLGVSEPTLHAWKKGLPASRPRKSRQEAGSEALVPVLVTSQKPGPGAAAHQGVAVVSPMGWRVEGLTLESAAQLLKRLSC